MIIPPLVQPQGPEKLPDRLQRFGHSKTFNVDVTEELLEFIDNGTLSVEIWGHRSGGFIEGIQNNTSSGDPGEVNKQKSPPEQ